MALHDLQQRTRYDPAEVEPRIAELWRFSGLFHPEPEGTPEENYSIAIPPPNVTGSLHMGHALNGSIQDVLIRYHRMLGRRTKWILGTDHAGIATQKQVERQVEREGTTREAMGREAFVGRVWRWREEYGQRIIRQYQRLGASCDYETERFTLDDDYVRAVLEVFVDLYDKGWIYRDYYLVNWDPGSRSAISDLEVVPREVTDTLYTIEYRLAGGGSLAIATVRPETMLADTAVAVNPEDDRYRRLIGESATLPLVGRRLPIIADGYVKTDFGTGALKITPGHDPNDFEIGRRHGLGEITVIGEDGRMTDAAGAPFAGLTVAEARVAVVEALDAEELISAREPYTHDVPYSHRSGERIEPLISLQWFMRMDELAKPAIEAVTSGRITFHPERSSRIYLDWMENIRPWCISRQLWWGHRLPVWYRGEETHVGTEAPVGQGWERDPDVLDTWFSSALWPFATLGWPDETPDLRAFYPTDVLSTGRDIIFLWVARMIMMGLEFTGEIPFSDVNIHSIIQAPDGRRMSKSLGTGIDPLDLIEGGPRPPVFAQGGDFPPYGADAVRFGLLAMSSGQDVRFSEEKIAQGQALANKLWNAARLALTQAPAGTLPEARTAGVEDRWILSRLQRVTARTAERIEAFDLPRAALELYDFIYGELCDWYLEWVKPRLREDAEDREDAAATLLHVLSETIALAHPFLPFVTEEIWSYVPGADGLLAAGRYPRADAALIDEPAERALGDAIAAVQAVRGWRDAGGVRPGVWVPARLEASGYEETAAGLARLARLELSPDGGAPVASVPVPGGAIQVLPSDAVDVEAAERRLADKRAHLRGEIDRGRRKLANAGFVSKAPAEVVEAEREKLGHHEAQLSALETR